MSLDKDYCKCEGCQLTHGTCYDARQAQPCTRCGELEKDLAYTDKTRGEVILKYHMLKSQIEKVNISRLINYLESTGDNVHGYAEALSMLKELV